ncbi:hypothetical protein NUU61_000028 [Penicillium alfredii]|uniref:SAM-dependent MTase RsmB/NOP-type domain-containing protein n=1 Tax=Penicillium alfredii TaxID=1506179 RepID=A0A9W9KPC5_9EURO|nr:uncharacterized protein NUU61_000028 [Penicillium alfredii]KAJ5114269.1 hypothetical protein NUU61_000028 [Penicillium alfredii]
MSLYFDAVALLTAPSAGGSFKSRIYSARDLRASPAQIYALITEASKWDRVLSEVIEHADILSLERKLTPHLALLLVHDHLLSKNGIAAPAAHPIRQAVERHKNRLKAEFTKARVRRGCASVEQLKAAVLREKRLANGTANWVYPRWVRINNIRTSLEEQLRTTFSSYQRVDTLQGLAQDEGDFSGRKPEPRLYLDPNIPDLVAVPFGADFTASTAYKNGEIILQDKASCFPAYLLLGDRGSQKPWAGDLVDGCAAPGNKTTHLASLLAKQQKKKQTPHRIFSMDASRVRSKTLQKMVSLAGADRTVTVLPGQDFLALDPVDPQFEHVSGLLLDPSCSGSGIIGRDDVPQLTLPATSSKSSKPQGKKRKRRADDRENEIDTQQSKATVGVPRASATDENDTPTGAIDHERLTKLSNLQARIVEHALGFSGATHVTYSTCSIHVIENEAVVARVLASEVAQHGGWRLLRRDEQPDGLRRWTHRGVRQDREGETDPKLDRGSVAVDLPDEALEACLRCWPGDAEGLGGFFIAGFVRDPQGARATGITDSDGEDEWEGFSD